ncbi:hypothetical protein B0H12DRAFT_1253807 [Mycena haematopus]|nr:hypothetical protein B0H12DRAFT_1253807 [Mycena haematopus]
MPNQRETTIKKAVKACTADSTFNIQLPWLLRTTWDTMLSTKDEMREGFKCLGRTALHFAFSLALTETLENCLLSEEVLSELLKKPYRRDARHRVASKGVGAVRDAVHIFVGGLCRLPKEARQAGNGNQDRYNHPVEARALRRIYAIQLAKKPFKVSKEMQQTYFDEITPPATPPSPSFPPFGSSIFGDVDDDAESSDSDCAESRSPGNHDGARPAGARLAALAAVPSKSEESRASTALQEPISLKVWL